MPTYVPDHEQPSEQEWAELMADRAEFEAAFAARPNGRLVRRLDYGGEWLTLTVFRRWGSWFWCIGRIGSPPRYSAGGCSEATFAVGDLWRTLTGL